MDKKLLSAIQVQVKLASAVRTVSDERMLVLARAEIKRCVEQVPANKNRLMVAGLEIPILELNVPDAGPNSYARFYKAVKSLIVIDTDDDFSLEFVEGHHSSEIIKLGLLSKKIDYF